MTNITPRTPITMTTAQFLGGIILLIGGMGGASYWATN